MFTKILTGIAGVVIGVGIATAVHANTNNWHCNAEDEVLIINNSCVHIDAL